MALPRELLESMGLTDEQVTAIIEANVDSITALKEQRDSYKSIADNYKASADRLAAVQKELNELKAAQGKPDEWKAKYEQISSEYEAFKSDQKNKENMQIKKDAYSQLLREAGVSDKRIASILKVTDLGSIELSSEGALVGAEKLSDEIKTTWSDFITTSGTQGAATSTPPANNGSRTFTADDIKGMSAAEINANWNDIKSSLK